MDDGGPESAAEAEQGDGDDDRRGAPDDQARRKGPEGTESRADHQDEGGHEGVDVQRSDPLAVLAGEEDAAAGTVRVHREVSPEELSLSANRAAKLQAAPDDRAPVPL